MTAAEKKSQSHARQKPKSKGGIESSLRWGRVVEHVEEIGGALKLWGN
jgi:hypothetical protein